MADRVDIINSIGREYLTSNIENGEFSYPKAFKKEARTFKPITDRNGRKYQNLDLRFVKDGISVLVETKQDIDDDRKKAEEQLSAYVTYEKELTGNRTIGILANTNSNKILVWRDAIAPDSFLSDESAIRSIDEYVNMFESNVNDKEQVMANTYALNELLHKHGIKEKLRSQFVGTCLLALKNGLDYTNPHLSTNQISVAMGEVLGKLLDKDLQKAEKMALLKSNVLDSQDVRELKPSDYREILTFVDENILPYINDKSTSGQDLLNLFFITFNKYVGKADKNQAFTPDHITDFMSKIVGVNKHSIILDPCCGSGSFLVRSMTMALDDCANESEQKHVKKHQIYGIEFDENVYGLATTNMLIHSDGNSNIRKGSCFDFAQEIKEARPTVILMNPPYNAQRKNMPEEFVSTWDAKAKEDPSKGLYFVKYIMDLLNSINHVATVAVLLPVACAIGSKEPIASMKKEILEHNTLDAVFSLPGDIFHPGASASACCMVFKVGRPHSDPANPDTFFGYFRDDGFKKKKNLGRVEQIDPETGKGMWTDIEKKWIDLYRNRRECKGLSCIHKVSGDDEWLCEAYMETDFSTLSADDFIHTVRSYLAYTIQNGVDKP